MRDYLSRELDDYLWMKRLPAERITAELRRLRVRPHFKTAPWLHQLVCFYIGVCRPEFLFLLAPGLGKTKLILDLITQFRREGRLPGPALVGVPRAINVHSWMDDIPVHSDLGGWPIDCEDIEEKWERLCEPRADVAVIDFQSLHWALSKRKQARGSKKFTLVPDEARIARVQRIYRFVNIDEVHKLANHQSLWFSLWRRMTAEAMFAYGMTGTIFGRDLEDIWGQFYLVDRGETFGENLGLFRGAFFTSEPNKWGRGEKYTYNKSMDRQLNRMMQHRSIAYSEEEVLDLPQRVMRIDRFTMGKEQREHYLRMVEGIIEAKGQREEVEGQWVRMRQIRAGYLKWKDDTGDHVIRFKENPLLDGLELRVEEVVGRSKVVVAYDYTETGAMICDRLKQMKVDHEWYYGGTKDHEASRRRFMTDPACRVFVMNSAAGGTGNDGLQKVANHLILYETPTSPRERIQVIKRVHRPGLDGRAFIHDMVVRSSMDSGILADIAENRDTFDSVVNGRRRLTRGMLLMD